MLTFNHVLTKAPLQLHSAKLTFSPSHSAFRRSFASQTSPDFEVTTQLLSDRKACIQTFEGHSDSANSVVFSPDGSRVVSTSADRPAGLWDRERGPCQHALEGHADSVNSVVFSPDGSRVASVSRDN